jgi:hypothetical protein
VLNAIDHETDLKSWNRARKIALIESVNPTWKDLSLKFGTSTFFVDDADCKAAGE